ncbi:hypothetical protein KIN20_003779 [Parelaphostrongylus tenuis]|uniref:Uncharacterized protein n=1 Tax=Parelaphostrongylus tenuis TaxID=148309 RepID=A0AAD5QIU3_PARTN|nr:hypothetical protein KIN20_003779 [Parelaphostrongylus tenuis]
MDRQANGGGFFQRCFGGSTTGQERQATSPPSRALSPYRDENDYATIDRLRFGKRESSMPASPRNVRFTEDPSSQIFNSRAQMQYRPRASGHPRGYGSRSTQQSLTQLDEATLDLLRLSSEPDNFAAPIAFTSSKRINPAADYLPKAASTSSVNKVIRSGFGGPVRVAQVYNWAVEDDYQDVTRGSRQQLGDANTNRTRARGLSPEAIRRNEMQIRSTTSEARDGQQAYGFSPPQPRRAIEEINGVAYMTPSNGYMSDSPIESSLVTRGLSSPLASPSPQLDRENLSPEYKTPAMTPTSTRRTETIIDYEQKKHGPPVVRTTVEGKLKMEKIVGADLITVDSCVSGAWTVRDTVTNYKIKSTIGKKSLILEEIKDGHSKFKITLIENGETKMEREATLEIPEFMTKKDYLTEVGQRLLKDLREDADAVSAVTHVEVEIIEDITNILKTYVIGERADDYMDEQMIDGVHYEAHVDRTPSPIEEKKVEKIYIDTLSLEDASHELEKAEINISREGHHFEGEGALKRVRRLESDESDEIVSKTRCANVAADCRLARREDSSTFTVHIAVPLTQTISMILTRRRAQKRKEFAKEFAMTQSVQQFEDESSLRYFTKVEPIEVEGRKLVQHYEEDRSVARVQEVLVQRKARETEADGRKYEMELQGQKLVGDAVIKRRGRTIDSESSEELALPQAMIVSEREAQGGQYEMEMRGVTLRGEKTFRSERRVYESESEESLHWHDGSPTTIDLIKKESNSFFDVVFEISNIHEPIVTSIKRAVMKTESCGVNSAFMLPKDNAEEASIVMKAKLMWRENFFGKELSEQHLQVTISLQNLSKPGDKEKSAERNLAAINHMKIERNFREITSEQLMMLYKFENTVPTTEEALVLRREKNRHEASFFTAAVEFEHITLNTLLSHSGEMLLSERTLKAPNTIKNAVRLKEMSLEHATSVIYLHKMLDLQDQYADTVARDKHIRSSILTTRAASESSLVYQFALKRQSSFPCDMVVQADIRTANTLSSSFRSWASENRMISTALMLNRGAGAQTAAIKISDRNRQETTTHVAEYGHAQQHCAVMLKNTGGIHGSTSAALAEAVTVDRSSIATISHEVLELPPLSRIALQSCHLWPKVMSFIRKKTGTTVSYGQIQPKPQANAVEEYLISEHRRLADTTTVSSTKESTIGCVNDVKHMDRSEKLEATFVRKYMEETSFKTFATQEEEDSSRYEYSRADQIYGVQKTRVETPKLTVSKKALETQDDSSFGLWKTLEFKDEKVAFVQSEANQEHLFESVHAPVKSEIDTARVFRQDNSADTSSVVNLDQYQSACRVFNIEHGECEKRFAKDDAISSASYYPVDTELKSEEATMYEFGSRTVGMTGTLGFLTPKDSEIDKASIRLVDVSQLQELKSVIATSDTSIEKSCLIKQKDTTRETSEQVLLPNDVNREERSGKTEVTFVGKPLEKIAIESLAAHKEEGSAQYEYSRKDQIYGVEKTQTEAPKLMMSKEASEAQDESSFGLWKTSDVKDVKIETLRGEANQEHLFQSVSAPLEFEIETTGEFRQDTSADTSSLVNLNRYQSASRVFNIEQGKCDYRLAKDAAMSSTSYYPMDTELKSEEATVHEFGSRTVCMTGALGFLTPKDFEIDEASIRLEDVRQLQELKSVIATSDTSIEKSCLIKQKDTTRETSEQVLLPNDVNREERSGKTEVTFVGKPLEKIAIESLAAHKEEGSAQYEYSRKDQIYGVEKTQTEAPKLMMSKEASEAQDESSFGLWKTSDVKDVKIETLRGEANQEHLFQSVSAPLEFEIETTGEFRQDTSADTSSLVNLNRYQSASRVFNIEQGKCDYRLAKDAAMSSTSYYPMDTELKSEEATVHEFGSRTVCMTGALGFLTPKDFEIDEASIRLEDVRQLQELKSVIATSDTSIEKSCLIKQKDTTRETSEQVYFLMM